MNPAPASLLSIIIPTRDSESTLEECLRSIRENGYPNYELIIVDGGSRDRTMEIARAYSDKIIRQNPPGGREEARNLGYFQARGEIIVGTDSDNVLEKGALEKMVRYFFSHPEVDAITGMNTKETPVANFSSQYKNLYLYKNFRRLPPEVNFLYGSLYGVRRTDYPHFSRVFSCSPFYSGVCGSISTVIFSGSWPRKRVFYLCWPAWSSPGWIIAPCWPG
jgi:glycosyltransferase involved in cell wall biosynthesis